VSRTGEFATAELPTLLVFAPRERARTFLRTAFPKRKWKTVVVRDINECREAFRSVLIDAALIDIGSASEQVELARERLRLAEAELAQAQERFRAGVAVNADAITALLALTASRAQLIDAETALRYSHLSLARAEGLLLDIQ